MSSSFPFPPFPTTGPIDSSPTPTQGTSNSSTTDASLYLYTFLATLVLLLAVSSAIVIRSLVLRRRNQRLAEEAIRRGTWLPNRFDSAAGRRRRDPGRKPQLWEAWLHPNEEGEYEANEKNKWVDIHPVSATYVRSPMSSPPSSGSAAAAAGAMENAVQPSSRRSRFMPLFTRRSSSSRLGMALSPVAGQPPPSASSATTAAPAVHFAVLIAMPSSLHSGHGRAGDENGPPVVEIGVVKASIRDGETEIPSRDGS